jgi:hypothetical protein
MPRISTLTIFLLYMVEGVDAAPGAALERT